MAERRKHERYEVKDGMLVVLGLDATQIGQIINMGHGGLSFHYKGNKNIISDPCEVSIIFDSKSTVRYSPFKFSTNIISDVKIEDNALHNSVVKKRCHMQFNDLSYYQIFWLKECIRIHTTGSVKSFTD
jgi:hypothetical protein